MADWAHFAQRIAIRTGLLYLDADTAEGSVCYAADAGLRMEYKLYFTDADMLQYIAARCNPVPEDPDTIPLPADAAEFWQAISEN